MKEIPLTQGKVAIVDDDNYTKLSGFCWHANRNRNTIYAGHYDREKGGNIPMHMEILTVPKGMSIDHINGNGLDNRRENLRIVTCRQNMQNLHIPKSSKHPGVDWNRQKKKWRAYIHLNKRKRHLGFFDDEIEAATAYRVACVVLTGVEAL